MLTILLPLDGSAASERAIPHAVALARSLSAAVTLLRVVPPAEFRHEDAFSQVDWRLRKRQAQSYLENIAGIFRADGVACTLRVEEGRPAAVIVAAAKASGAQLLVMSTHGHGGAFDFPRGSVAGKVLASFQGSVFLVGPHAAEVEATSARYRRLLVPIDGAHQSECALRVAALLAQEQAAELAVTYVAQSTDIPFIVRHDYKAVSLCSELAELVTAAARRKLDEVRAQLPAELRVQTGVVFADRAAHAVSRAIARYDADLLVASNDLLNGASGLRAEPVPMLILSANGIGAALAGGPERGARDQSPGEPDHSTPPAAVPDAMT